MKQIVHVILSGGVGSRLWPVSRKSMPKQYIPMFGEKSLFQITAERNKHLAERVLVVGNVNNHELSKANLIRAGIDNYTEVIEASPRNTAVAIAFAALGSHPEDILIITPSDHIITNDGAYENAIQEAIELAKQGYLVTFGINPTRPETGYGYIEFEGNSVKSFREKPDFQTANIFVESQQFLWNSGMFCFEAKTYLDELGKFEPDILVAAKQCFDRISEQFLPLEETLSIPSKSIDYAVMERSDKIKVIPSQFGWSDLGSFESIWQHWEEQGENHHFNNNNCVVGSKKHVEFLGVDNLVLVETDDAILVLSKGNSQDVKKIYERLEAEKPELVN